MTENSHTMEYRTEPNPDAEPEDREELRQVHALDPDNDGVEMDVMLLYRALVWITEHPEAHNQGTWVGWRANGGGSETSDEETVARIQARQRDEGTAKVRALPDTACGTTGCLFGWAAILGGAPVVIDVRTGRYGTELATIALADLDQGDTSWRRTGGELLGLSPDNARALSDACNTRGDLWRMASILTAGEIAVPAEFAGHDGIAEAAAYFAEARMDVGTPF
jgi:hypothetical protein